jgi:hypothetical protein
MLDFDILNANAGEIYRFLALQLLYNIDIYFIWIVIKEVY